jgi:hypothetical protein
MNDTHTCTTTTAFGVYGIEDGQDLIQRTYREVTREGGEPDLSEGFDELGDAFRAAFVDLTGEEPIPRDVAAAVEDGRYFTREEYAGTGADLRTVVVPEFYREVADFLCAYR